MDKTVLLLTILLFSVLSGCFPFNDDDWPREERESTYLDYIKAREQQYEDALRLRNALRNDEGRYLDPDGDDYDDDDPDDQDGRRSTEDYNETDDDETGTIDRKNSQRINRLKQEIHDVDSPNHIRGNHEDSTSKSNSKKSQKKSPDYIGNKKKKITTKKQKDKQKSDKRNSGENKGDPKKENHHESHNILETETDVVDKKTKIHVVENDDHINEYSQLSDADSKDNVKGESQKKDDDVKSDNVKSDGKKVISSGANKSTTTSKPGSLPQPKQISSKKNMKKLDKALFMVVVAACSVAGVAGLILAGYCWYKLRNEQDDLPEEDTKKYVKKKKKPRKPELTNDEKLAKSAEVFHYMHTKKQLAAMEKSGPEKKANVVESDSSDEESDNTVYECPGLAPPGDMKVVNPLFSDTEKDHSDARSEGSHVSSPTRERSPPEQKEVPK